MCVMFFIWLSTHSSIYIYIYIYIMYFNTHMCISHTNIYVYAIWLQLYITIPLLICMCIRWRSQCIRWRVLRGSARRVRDLRRAKQSLQLSWVHQRGLQLQHQLVRTTHRPLRNTLTNRLRRQQAPNSIPKSEHTETGAQVPESKGPHAPAAGVTMPRILITRVTRHLPI